MEGSSMDSKQHVTKTEIFAKKRQNIGSYVGREREDKSRY